MHPSTLALGFVVPYLSGGLLMAIGEMIRRRAVASAPREALLGFAAFWYGFGATMVCYGTFSLLVFLHLTDIEIHLTLLHLLSLPLSIGLAGLVYYLLFIYTGRRGWLVPVLALYTLFFAFNQYRYAAGPDPHLLVTPWQAGAVVGAPDGAQAGLFRIFTAVLAVPVLVAVVAYASLLFQAKGGEQRYRIAMISGAIFLWFAVFLVGFLTSDPTASWKPLLYQGMGIPVGLLVLLGYRPPESIRRRFTQAVPRRSA